MIFTNCLPEDSYEGEVNGITMSWHQNAKGRLPELAEKYGADAKKLKAMAEHLTHASLVRLGKPTGFIL
ncbi:hypothetical protein TRV_07902 [Trichophyton verrucosum HKI 0517]|uniref:Uncharacterized protein n=1 Tax=Trichophyton verrucosum (strain HKI 0517) TaxID=663202 RepID=D4DL28_TRIVH|nr:uncharacterized protein TRV_07902 [Trichophyton verrucosum HKI 0517]EFE37421.1 hypothetical protein TRV_07902 [Trichophyton verrucosum HKI 0517]